jgi:phosphatidylserine/phosphatidylglycerophosphate/cardiolipin synthase-like enzyme
MCLASVMKAAMQNATQATCIAAKRDRFQLFNDHQEFFFAVFATIAQARREIFLETCHVADDKVGRALRSALLAAAMRGVRVFLWLDSPMQLTRAFLEPLVDAGAIVSCSMEAPVSTQLSAPLPVPPAPATALRNARHRKLGSVDGHLAFIGDIGFSADRLSQTRNFDKLGCGDYPEFVAQINGALAEQIRNFLFKQLTVEHVLAFGAHEVEVRTPFRGVVADAAQLEHTQPLRDVLYQQ